MAASTNVHRKTGYVHADVFPYTLSTSADCHFIADNVSMAL